MPVDSGWLAGTGWGCPGEMAGPAVFHSALHLCHIGKMPGATGALTRGVQDHTGAMDLGYTKVLGWLGCPDLAPIHAINMEGERKP